MSDRLLARHHRYRNEPTYPTPERKAHTVGLTHWSVLRPPHHHWPPWPPSLPPVRASPPPALPDLLVLHTGAARVLLLEQRLLRPRNLGAGERGVRADALGRLVHDAGVAQREGLHLVAEEGGGDVRRVAMGLS